MNTEYNVSVYDLTDAGSDTVELEVGFLAFLRAVDSAGVEAPLTLIELALGDAVDDWIPFTPGSIMRIQNAQKSGKYKLRWAAQAGVTIYFMWGSNANNLDIEVQRASQLVVGDLASTAAPGKVTVGTTSGLIAAANPNRKALTIFNNGTATIYISDDTATTDDFPIAPGASYTTTTTTAAIYGISGSAGQDVRTLEEGA